MFCQTFITDKDTKNWIIVRLRGQAIDILGEIASEVYLEYVRTNKKGKKTLLVQCMNALFLQGDMRHISGPRPD